MGNLVRTLEFFVSDRSGITSVEYALLLAIGGGGILAGAFALEAAVSGSMTDSANCIESDDPQADCQ